jgi:hypothetical protein
VWYVDLVCKRTFAVMTRVALWRLSSVHGAVGRHWAILSFVNLAVVPLCEGRSWGLITLKEPSAISYLSESDLVVLVECFPVRVDVFEGLSGVSHTVLP